MNAHRPLFLSSVAVFLGLSSLARASVTVLGDVTPPNPATWTSLTAINIGLSGSGAVTINGSGVAVGSATLGLASTSSGSLIIDGTGSILSLNHLVVGQFGTGSVVLSHGGQLMVPQGFASFGTSGRSSLVVDGPGSRFTALIGMSVGQSGGTSVVVKNGGVINNGSAIVNIGVGLAPSSNVILDGSGSTWFAGAMGLGSTVTFTINRAAKVELQSGFSMTQGSAFVISGGSQLKASSVSVAPGGLLSITAGDNSRILHPFGNPVPISNSGTVRISAAPGSAPGTYKPIDAAFLPGTIQPLGGTWDSGTLTFEIKAPVTGNAGQPVNIDLAQAQRMVITDPAANKQVMASFQPAASATNLSLSASLLTTGETNLLLNGLSGAEQFLSGWNFIPTNYAAGSPVYLSMQVGAGRTLDELAVWHFDGAAWAKTTPRDLSYDGNFASFTVTGFSGYAVTAVPEPAGLAVLALASLGSLRRSRRKPCPA